MQIWNKGKFYIKYGPNFYFFKKKDNPLGQNERCKNIIWVILLPVVFAIKVGNTVYTGFPDDASGKEPTCQYRRHKRCGFSPWMGKIPWRRKWQPTPVQCSWLENTTDRKAWWATLHRVAENQTQLKWLSTHT